MIYSENQHSTFVGRETSSRCGSPFLYNTEPGSPFSLSAARNSRGGQPKRIGAPNADPIMFWKSEKNGTAFATKNEKHKSVNDKTRCTAEFRLPLDLSLVLVTPAVSLLDPISRSAGNTSSETSSVFSSHGIICSRY
jgi:hypothetical protein